MLNEEEILVLDKNNKDITGKVVGFSFSNVTVNYGERSYQYSRSNLKIFTNPINLEDSIITTPSKTLSSVSKALKFNNYVKVFFKNGENKIYNETEIIIKNNLISRKSISSVFGYLKEMASQLKISDVVAESTEKNDSSFLSKIYEKIDVINEDSVINEYINGLTNIGLSFPSNKIYPFSFNLSQQKAVRNAFQNRISVIEGPPGTGKTQTILNIIANAIINNKTVAVLSNNNSATDNVYDKLEAKELGSLCAKLGKRDNVDNF